MSSLIVLLLSAGPTWGTDLAAALAAAGDRLVVVSVSADWCTPCHQLHDEVLESDEGARLLDGAVPVQVDFETPQGRRVAGRYGILSLPTTLIIGPGGDERGRVEGYPGRAAWVSAYRDALAGRAGLAALAERARRAPADLAARRAWAQGLLVRGDPRGEAMLREMMRRPDAHGAAAARVLGRWLLRAKGRAKEAVALFEAALQRYRDLPDVSGFRYWAALARHRAGDRRGAIALFDAEIARDPKAFDARLEKADFMAHVGADAAATLAAVRAALALDATKAWPHYLLAQVQLRLGVRPAAAAAIARARALEPGTAIFTRFQRRHGL